MVVNICINFILKKEQNQQGQYNKKLISVRYELKLENKTPLLRDFYLDEFHLNEKVTKTNLLYPIQQLHLNIYIAGRLTGDFKWSS